MSLDSRQPSKNLSYEVNKSSLSMSSGTFLSRILGFFRDMVIGYIFTRTQTDAFFVAFRFPNFFRRFFGEGALTASFIPVFIDQLHSSKDSRILAQNLMNSVYTLLLIGVSTFTVLGIYFMDHIVQAMFGSYSFSLVEGKIDMTITLARFLFFYLFLVVNYAYLTAIANALGKFFIPALAPAIFNVMIISCCFLIPQDLFKYPSMVLVVGVLIGGVLQTIMVAILLMRLKFLPRLRFSFVSNSIYMVLSRFVPSIVGVGGFALIGLTNVFFAGWLEEGAHTFIYYADRLLELPRSLVAVSMGTALLPTLSKLATTRQISSMLNLAADQRDLILFIILPCSIGFYFLGTPIIEVLFARGKFDALAVQETSKVLSIYSVLLVTLCLCQLISTSFFVVKNAWYPALSTLVAVVSHIILASWWIPKWDLQGLIWATTGASFIQLICLFSGYFYFIGSFYLQRSGLRLLKTLPLLVIFAAYIHYFFGSALFTFEKIFSSNISQFFALFLTVLSSIFIYIYLSTKFRLHQSRQCLDLLQRMFQRKK